MLCGKRLHDSKEETAQKIRGLGDVLNGAACADNHMRIQMYFENFKLRASRTKKLVEQGILHTGEQLEQQHKVQYSCWHPSWSLTRLDGIPSPYRALDVGCRVAGVRELCAPQPVCLSAELCGQSMELFQKKGTHKYELTLHQNFLNCVVPGAGKTGSGIKLMKSTCLELGCTWPQGSHGSRCKKSLCKCWRHLGKHSYTRHCIDILGLCI